VALAATVVLLIGGAMPWGTAPAWVDAAAAPSSAPGGSSPALSYPAAAGELGGDWPTYLGDNARTAANLFERTLAPSNVSELGVVWSLKMNGSEFSSPTVTNGTAYVGSWDGYEYAIAVATGHILWKKYLGVSSTCYVGGTESSATVWNGTVYVGGGNDYWYALDASNGSVEWRIKVTDYGSTSGNFDWASPLLSRGYEYIGLASCSDSPLTQGKLLQVDLHGNHSVTHEFDFVPNGKVGGTIWSTSAVDESSGTVWVATGNEGGSGQKYADAIVALNASDLSLIGSWQIPGLVGQDLDFGSGPTLFHDASGRALVVANDKNGVAYALNRSNVTTNGSWKPVWEATTGDVYAPLAFDGARLFSGGAADTIGGHHYASTVYRLDPASGATVWETGLSVSQTYGAPAYANGLVVVGAGSDLVVLDANNGSVLREITLSSTGETISGSPCIVDGRIFIGTGDFGTSGHLVELGLPLSVNGTALPANGTPDGWLAFEASASGGSPAYRFAWQFGDGGAATGPTPVHAFPHAGMYSVDLTVTDATNATSTTSFNVTVARSPQPMTATISAVPAIGLSGVNVTFGATVFAGGGEPYLLAWDFGDGTPTAGGASDWNESHSYAVIGSFAVLVHVTDGWGRQANATTTVAVVPPLTLTTSVAPASGTVPFDVTLRGVVSGGASPGPIFWQFGDGSSGSNGPTVTHTYATAGSYLVSAEVRDGLGEDVWQNLTVTAVAPSGGGPPLVAEGSVEVIGGDCITNRTVVNVLGDASGGEAPYAFAWDFGDGSASVPGSSASHGYALVGDYVVTLNVTDTTGASAVNESFVTIPTWTCPPSTSHPAVPSPSAAGWATPTNLALLGVVAAAVVVVAILIARKYRR